MIPFNLSGSVYNTLTSKQNRSQEVMRLTSVNIWTGEGDIVQAQIYLWICCSWYLCVLQCSVIGCWVILRNIEMDWKGKSIMQWTALISFLTFQGKSLESEAALSQCTGRILCESSFFFFFVVAFFPKILLAALGPVQMPSTSGGLSMCVHDCVQGCAKPITVGNSCLASN